MSETPDDLNYKSPATEGYSSGIKHKIAKTLHLAPPGKDHHQTTQEHAGAGSHAAVEEVIAALGSERGIKIVENFARAQVHISVRELLSEGGRQTLWVGGQEVFSGAYDGIERKINAIIRMRPWYLEWIDVPIVETFVVLLGLGILLSVWRFALFGI